MTAVRSLYPRLGTAAISFERRPAATYGGWTQVAAGFTVANALYIGPTPGDTEIQTAPTFTSIANGTTDALLCAQVCGDPLARQTIAAGTWRVGFAARLTNAGIAFKWSGQAALYVINGLTGERRGAIFNRTRIGSLNRVATVETTCLATVAGFAVEVFTGDYLALELGIAVTNAAAATVPAASIYADGTQEITGDALARSDVRSSLAAPQDLLLALPLAGEPEAPTVSHGAAVQLLKEHFPPYSALLYDWDASDTTLYKIFAFLGDALKVFGYDQIDRLLREISPLTCVELMPEWEAALGISPPGSQTMAQRRAAVLAGIRTLGPLTPYNLLSALAQLAGYAPGTYPELIEFDATQITPVFTQTVNTAIPEVDTFDLASEYTTPVILDGGETWPTGAMLKLDLGAAAGPEIHVRLEAPNYTSFDLVGGGVASNTLYLRTAALAGGGAHGSWRMLIRRDIGSAVNTLSTWSLTTYGVGRGGRGQRKGNWSVYFDSSHRAFDERTARALLDKVTQAYGKSWLVFDKTSIPGTADHVPGRFLPGS